ncbi:hypothetical protein B0H19DRAFT_1150954 [Mycena capillaripes]|nr:hypothetical protein B0H19DRAFT_1150954 [Mycena capillaripes]
MSRISLNDIPQELLLEILTLVDGKTLTQSCTLVCHLWKDIIHSCPELRLLVQLWADDMVPGDSRGATALERLDAVYKRRRAWASLDWATREVIPIEAMSRSYELVDGIFAQQTVILHPAESFSTIWLPSARDLTAKTTSIDDLKMEPRDFVLDPTQDLVAFVYERPGDIAYVECRTLSTMQPHPLTALPVLSFPVNIAAGSLLVDLADDVISLFFDQHVVILNWREGAVVVDFDCSNLVVFSPFSFNLLTSRSYILGCGGQSGKIEIWSFEAHDRNEPPIRMATLQLPEHSDSHYIATQVHSGPFRANPAARRPFSKSNEGRLCVISVDYGVLFVHHRYLLKYLSNPKDGIIVPWDAWGPRNSRMLAPMPHRWFRYVHGERVVLPPCPENPRLLQILDFSMVGSRIPVNLDQASKLPTPHFSTELHTEPSTLDVDILVSKTVTTSLPYRKTMRYVDEEHGLYLIDEEQIIGVNHMESQMTVYTF